MPTAPRSSAAAELARWPDRPVSATVAPAVARAEAMANPSPLVPPVTSTFIRILRSTNRPRGLDAHRADSLNQLQALGVRANLCDQ